jgi:D-glycero-alpha-D-manno-heptose 1-phosphate guanylyltransferase
MTAAIILAGGLGTRLRSAVPDLPKPMAPVAGRPFLAHQMDHWIAQGVDRFVLSVGYRHEAIVDHFGDRYRDARIRYALETSPLGTGGALQLAAHELRGWAAADERFLLLNGDTWFDVPLPALVSFAQAADADWCFALFRADEPGRYMGLAVDDGGRITALDTDDQRRGRLANGGVYLVHPRSLRSRDRRANDKSHPRAPSPVSLEAELLPTWLARGQRFFGLPVDAPFIDIGVPADYHRAADVLPVQV